MCGIFGAVGGAFGRDQDRDRLDRVLASMKHRGPDDSGIWTEPRVVIASTRLSILDLSPAGHMPMASPDGRYVITYNGEVYNFQGLRASLESRGHRFRSGTDTEVVLAMFAEHGPAMLPRLNGMFAIAIWDRQEQTLFLARDRMGVKPLYYARPGDGLLFASEQKTLFAAGVDARFEERCWPDLLCFRYTAGEDTPWRGVLRLLPGHWGTWRNGTWQTRRWWRLDDAARTLREKLPSDVDAWYRDVFDDAVQVRRISDVPVGIMLSGGIDSGSVAASVALAGGHGASSFTVRFNEPGYDEGEGANAVVRKYGLSSHEITVSGNAAADGLAEASRLSDEPLAHSSHVHMLLLARFAKPRVTVLLSGEGGDETLGGYVRYRPLAKPMALRLLRSLRIPSAIQGIAGRRLRKLQRMALLTSQDDQVLFNACDSLPQDLEAIGCVEPLNLEYRRVVLDEAGALYGSDLARQAMYLDQHTFLCSLLDRNDRMTMGASIECRTPMLDYRLVEMAAAIPTRTIRPGTKRVLRSAMNPRLPDEVRRAGKWGFGVPWARYFREVPQLRSLLEGLASTEPVASGPFHKNKVDQVVRLFLAGDDRQADLLTQLAFVSVWYRSFGLSAGRPG